MGGFPAQVGHLGNTQLHPSRQLVTGNPGRQLGISLMVPEVAPVLSLEKGSRGLVRRLAWAVAALLALLCVVFALSSSVWSRLASPAQAAGGFVATPRAAGQINVARLNGAFSAA